MKINLILGKMIVLTLVLNACSQEDTVAGEVNSVYLEVTVDGNKKVFSDVKGCWVDGELLRNNSY